MKQDNNIKPFIRWAGGKTKILNHLEKSLPDHFNNYHEPFLGSGAFFFYLASKNLIKKAYLNDLNKELINSYKQLKKNQNLVISRLKEFKNNSKSYYSIRESIPDDDLNKATRFIFLNRTSFNGLYRVNRQGKYNVPFGNKEYKTLFDYDNLQKVSQVLKLATLTSKDFFKTLDVIKENDLVFIDPPYTVAHENNGFIEYNQKIFQWIDQERILEYIKIVKQKGAFFIMTNASHYSIKKLFKPIGIPNKIERYSVIGGLNAYRGIVHEYLFTNIE